MSLKLRINSNYNFTEFTWKFCMVLWKRLYIFRICMLLLRIVNMSLEIYSSVFFYLPSERKYSYINLYVCILNKPEIIANIYFGNLNIQPDWYFKFRQFETLLDNIWELQFLKIPDASFFLRTFTIKSACFSIPCAIPFSISSGLTPIIANSSATKSACCVSFLTIWRS